MTGLLEGKVAMITGAAAGIGKEIALAAAREGASLVLGDIQDQAGEELVDHLQRGGAKACFRHTDVRKSSDLKALVETAGQKFAVPDIAFANAGVEGPACAPWDCLEKDFMNVLDINLTGIWRTIVSVLPAMVERGSGSIVATASVGGLVGAGGLTAYVASKHGVVGLVKSIAIDTARSGIRVNAICPGMIETSMLDRLGADIPGFLDAILALKPMGRIGKPREAAEAAIWLASEKASFVTGHTLAVDGGYAAQ